MKFNLKYLFSIALSFTIAVNSMYISALPVISFDVESAGETELPVHEPIDYVSLSSSEDIYSFAPELEFTVEIIHTTDSYSETTKTTNKSEVSLLANRAPFEGSGTQNDPYLISTKRDLKNFGTFVASETYTENRFAHFKLTDNIDFGGDEWTPVGSAEIPFSGVFDGNGYTVSNFKITEAKSPNNKFYIGFFGFIKNGSVTGLNLTDIVIDVHEFVTKTEKGDVNNISNGNIVNINVGGLAGCIDSIGAERRFIENCSISDTSISISSNFRIYGGGLAGFVDSSEGADVTFSGCSAEAILNYTIDDTSFQSEAELKSESNRSRIRSGGLIGYIGVSGLVKNDDNTVNYVPTKLNIENCSARVDNITSFFDINADSRNYTHSGGLVGSVGMEYKGAFNVSESYSSNMVYSYGDSDVYTGAFIGYITSTDSITNITDSFSNSRVYVQCKTGESYTSGFVAIDIVNPRNPGTYSYADCYSASDIIIDVKGNVKDSISATFLAFNNGNHTLSNCYSVDGWIHNYGSAVLGTHVEKVVSQADAMALSTFSFDESIWEISMDSSYKYPVLVNTEYKTGVYAAYEFVSEGTPILTQNNLAYGSDFALPESTPESLYIFTHWSIYPKGNSAEQIDKVTGSYVLFPNFSNDYVSFQISFSANGEIFETNQQKYNSTVVFPAPKNKPSDALFSYEFSHWSLTENGPELSNEEIIVKGVCTYYAVYFEVPNNGWDGSSFASFTKGNGTKENPYEISDGFQLYNLSKLVNEGAEGYADAYYIITRNIDLSGNEWTPIGTAENPFSGNFNGNGYSVYNFKFTNPSTRYVGLFGCLDAAEISYLEINGVTFEFKTNSFVSSTENRVYIGGIAGYVTSSSIDATARIKECAVTGTTITVNLTADYSNSAVYAGAIAGHVADYPGYVYIENCYSNADMNIGGYDYTTPNTNIVYCGGIVGDFLSRSSYISRIDKCYFNGRIAVIAKTAGYAGGIVAFIRNSSDYVGGIQSLGYLHSESSTGDLRNCFSAPKSITVNRNALESHAGIVYAFKANSSKTKVTNCAVSPDAVVSAHDVVSNTGLVIPDSINCFKDATYLNETLGFDFNNIWQTKNDNFPTLKVFNRPESYFKLLRFNLNSESGILSVNISSKYLDVTDYIVLLGVYNDRGKMIGFKTVTVTDATNAQTTEIKIENVYEADKCKLSIVLPKTLELIEHTKEI